MTAGEFSTLRRDSPSALHQMSPVMGLFFQEQTRLFGPKPESDESSLPFPVKPMLLQVKCWDFHRGAVSESLRCDINVSWLVVQRFV
jgi:hypothetical protein